jgi:hypothetical protein
MKAKLGISLNRYSYLKLAKTLSFLVLIMSSVQQNWRKGQNRSEGKVEEAEGRGEKWPKQCMHI